MSQYNNYRNAKVLGGILYTAYITVACQITRIPDYKNVSSPELKMCSGGVLESEQVRTAA